MKHRIISSLQSAALALAAWLLPIGTWATVEVLGITYELDEATHTAVVAPQTNKDREMAVIPSFIFHNDVRYDVTAIGDCAFLDCHDLSEVRIIGSSITSIGFSAFERCYFLSTLYLTEGLTTIGSEAFKDCRSLYNVPLPSTLLSLGYRAFYGCNSLATITIPKSVTALGDECLSGTSLQILAVERTSPLSVKEGALAGIDKANCLLSVPEGAKAAYQKARVWRDFTHIEEGILETGACGESATYTIHSDGTMTITGTGEVVEFLPGKVSSNFIRELTIGEGITRIGDGAFTGVWLFYGWSTTEQWQSLTTIHVPSTLASIGQLVFVETPWYNAQPDGVVYAGKVVCGVKGMEGQDIVLQEGTLGISPTAFWGVHIPSLYIPSSVENIYPYVSSYEDAKVWSLSYDSIDYIEVDPANPYFDSRDDCNAIIESATNRLIVGTPNMTIPDGVTIIGTFALCRLTSVNIPASVTSIEEFAFTTSYFYYIPGIFWDYMYFTGQSPIESIRMQGSTPPEVSTPTTIYTDDGQGDSNNFGTFSGVSTGTCVLYVPKGSKEAYASAPGWKDFVNIEEYALAVLIDGLWYKLDYDKNKLTAEVVAPEEGSSMYQGDVVIPESVEYEGVTYSVTSIGAGAFMGCTELTSLTIPPSLTEMWDDAIDGCSALQRINISDLSAWLRVEGKAYYLDFVGNSTISTIPLYLNGEPLCEVVIPGDIREILGCSFYGAPLITSLYIPDNSVYRIGYFAFEDCPNLIFAKFGDSVGSFGYGSFLSTELKTIIMNVATPPYLDWMVFTSRDIPLYVPHGSLAAYQNGEMDPSDPGQTFKFFRNIREFTISPDAIYYGLDPETQTAKVISTDFYVMDEAPTDVRVPETIDCDGTTYTVTALGLKAFELGSAMTRLTLPGTITSVDDEVLNRCTSLTEVYCYAEEVPAATERAFQGTSVSEAVLYVPAASVEAYRAASPWNTFADIRPITTTAISGLDASGEAAPEVTYGIDGRIVTSPSRGVTIVRRGDKVMKVLR